MKNIKVKKGTNIVKKSDIVKTLLDKDIIIPMLELAPRIMNNIDSITNYLAIREQTKQTEIESTVRIEELKYEISKVNLEATKVLSECQIILKSLDNQSIEYDIELKKLDILEKIVEKIGEENLPILIDIIRELGI